MASPSKAEARQRLRSDTSLFRQDESDHAEFIRRTNEDLRSQYTGGPGPQSRPQPAPQAKGPPEYRGQMVEDDATRRARDRADSEMFRQDERNHAEFIRRTNIDLGLHSKYEPVKRARPRPSELDSSSNSDFLTKSDSGFFRDDERTKDTMMKRIDADLQQLHDKSVQQSIRSRMNEQLKRADWEASKQDERNHQAFMKRTGMDLRMDSPLAKGVPKAASKDADDLLFRKPEPRPSSAWWNCFSSSPLVPHPKTNRPESHLYWFVPESALPIAHTWNRGVYHCESWGEEAFGEMRG